MKSSIKWLNCVHLTPSDFFPLYQSITKNKFTNVGKATILDQT